MEIRQQVAELGKLWQREERPVGQEELITVSAATRNLAFAYERFRNTLEPAEEDILRRSAIFRILERRVWEDRPALVSSTALLQELIRARYIQPAPQRLGTHVARVLERTRQVAARLDVHTADVFLHIAAVSIDQILFPRQRREALVRLMYHDVFARTVWTDEMIPHEERPAQLYVACHRALFASTDDELMTHYFINHFPVWGGDRWSQASAEELAAAFPVFSAFVHGVVHHRFRNRLLHIIRPHAVAYRILWEMLRTQGGSMWSSQEHLQAAVRDAVGRRVEFVRARMSRRAWHSILFLFFTKLLLTILVELPYELIFLGQTHLLALGTNIVFHPVLLFGASITARLPGTTNTEHIISQVSSIVTGVGELPTIVARAPRRYGAITWSVFALVYALLFLGIFWGIFVVLNQLQFSLVAMFLFIVFLGLVSFLAFRIRRSVDEIRVMAAREGAFSTVFSFLSLPLLEFGRWLTENISQLNIVLFFMDRVLEDPFKLLIDVIEEWFAFVRERKEEIV